MYGLLNMQSGQSEWSGRAPLAPSLRLMMASEYTYPPTFIILGHILSKMWAYPDPESPAALPHTLTNELNRSLLRHRTNALSLTLPPHRVIGLDTHMHWTGAR